MKNLLCFLGFHRRVYINKERGIPGGICCERCDKILMKSIKWPKPPLRIN